MGIRADARRGRKNQKDFGKTFGRGKSPNRLKKYFHGGGSTKGLEGSSHKCPLASLRESIVARMANKKKIGKTR